MTILEMNFFASVLILVIVIIRALVIHKLPKKTFLALWSVVICRLLVPFSISSRFSIYTTVNRLGSAMTEQGTTSFLDMSAPNSDFIPQAVNQVEILIVSAGISPLTIAWFVGMIACILFFLVTHYLCRREYKAALPIENGYIQKWLTENSLRRTVQIRQSERITAPLTYGIWEPVVLLPKTMDWTNEKQLQYVLSHEYTHIKRFDIVAKWLLAIVVSIYWFNPFVWVMYIIANRDLELSCDETVVRSLGEGLKSSYAMTLISLEEKRSSLTPLCNNFSKNSIEERIVSIMKMKKTSLFGIILALSLVIGVTTAFATSKKSSNNFTALLDSENNLIEGLVDNGVLPKFFETDIETNPSRLFTHGSGLEKAIGVNGMVAAIGVDGTEGWVYARELETYPKPNTPEEAIEIQNQNALDYPNGLKYINLYDKDGTTIIGKFEIGIGSNNVIYKDNSINESRDQIRDADNPDINEIEQVSISKDNSFIVAWPIPGQYRISSGYGMRKHPLTGESEFHTGIDIPSPLGTDIVAVDSGVVKYVFEDNENGKTIIISHDENLESEYRHCSEIILQEGQTVEKGMVIARVGDTGNAYSTHLHLGLKKDGKYINPIE